MVKEKDGAKKFTEAADKFFGEVSDQLDEIVTLKDIPGIQRATAIAELIYKVNQSLKLMKEEKKPSKSDNAQNDRSMPDVWADNGRK
jgi:hypothetical protein